MNVRPGGKQPKMHDTVYEDKHGEKISQSMVFDDGTPKGLRQVLLERHGEEFVKGKKQDELVLAMEQESDFLEELSVLEKECKERGDILVKGVKFHAELMPIESAYRNVSNFCRKHNKIGCSKGFVDRIESSYEEENSGLSLELKRKQFRALFGLYINGGGTGAIKKYHSLTD